MLRIAIDCDKTLCDGPPLRLRSGAVDALRAFKAAGHHLTLHSARSTPDGAAPVLEDEAGRFWQYGEIPARTVFQWNLFDEMRTFLKANGIWEMFDDVWVSPGKPLVDHFIEDLSLPPDWAVLKRQLAPEALSETSAKLLSRGVEDVRAGRTTRVGRGGPL